MPTNQEIEAFRRRCIASGAVFHMDGRELLCCGVTHSDTGKRGSYRALHRWCGQQVREADGVTKQIVLGKPERPTICRSDRHAVAAALLRQTGGVEWRD
jgi:hypothetical protein